MDDATFIALVIDYGWTRAELRMAAEAWNHLNQHPACEESLALCECLRVTFRSQSPLPIGGWEAFQKRLHNKMLELSRNSETDKNRHEK